MGRTLYVAEQRNPLFGSKWVEELRCFVRNHCSDCDDMCKVVTGLKQLSYSWNTVQYRGADKSLARPERKQATATENFEFRISYFRFAGCCSILQTGHITLSSTPDQQLEKHSTKCHRQKPLYNTLELLMMGIVVLETCWASNKICNKNLCCI